MVRKMEIRRMNKKERRRFKQRFHNGRTRTFPSADAMRRYLGKFHNAQQEQLRKEHTAFIPAKNGHLKSLEEINRLTVAAINRIKPSSLATIDMDATLAATQKRSALFCYKKFPAYQPLNSWWAEQQLVVHSEFRDGNVGAGAEQLRVFKRTLEMLPNTVKTVRLRSDSAGYQWELLKYCAQGKDKRFGVIKFAVSCDITPAFKAAVVATPEEQWRPLKRRVDGDEYDTVHEWAEICYVPNAIGDSKNGPAYRFIATRKRLPQLELPGLEQKSEELLPRMVRMGDHQDRYMVNGLVNNYGFDEMAGDEIIWWLRERCGKSEEVHSIMKQDLAGGKFPSGLFGANAGWWGMMILALNLTMAVKRIALGKQWIKRRMKALRFWLINIAGRLIESGRQLCVVLSGDNRQTRLLVEARRRMHELVSAPT